jgi:hypothetical protein
MQAVSLGPQGQSETGTHVHQYFTLLSDSAASRCYLCVESGNWGRNGISFGAAGEAGNTLPAAMAGSK